MPMLGLLGLLAGLAACAGTGSLRGSDYQRGAVHYRVGTLPAEWRRIHVRGADLVFRHQQGGTLMVSAQCPSSEDAPLEVLVNHLLFDIEHQKEHSRALLTVDGRAALRIQLDGELDGVRIALDLVVLKKDGCAYDLQLATSPQKLAARQPDFEAFLRGFSTASAAATKAAD